MATTALPTPTLYIFRGFVPELAGVDSDAAAHFHQTPIPTRMLASAGALCRAVEPLPAAHGDVLAPAAPAGLVLEPEDVCRAERGGWCALEAGVSVVLWCGRRHAALQAVQPPTHATSMPTDTVAPLASSSRFQLRRAGFVRSCDFRAGGIQTVFGTVADHFIAALSRSGTAPAAVRITLRHCPGSSQQSESRPCRSVCACAWPGNRPARSDLGETSGALNGVIQVCGGAFRTAKTLPHGAVRCVAVWSPLRPRARPPPATTPHNATMPQCHNDCACAWPRGHVLG